MSDDEGSDGSQGIKGSIVLSFNHMQHDFGSIGIFEI